jgi:uncharacterized protein (DUF1800 family)
MLHVDNGILSRVRLRGRRNERFAPLSRRQFLAGGAAGLAAFGVIADRTHARGLRMRLEREKKAVRSSPRAVAHDPNLLALIGRATFGFSQTTYDEVSAIGHDAWVEQQLDSGSIDDSVLDTMLAAYPSLAMSSQEIYTAYLMDQGVPQFDLWYATLLRFVHSERQLHARMVEFWTDHFNIDIRDGLEWAFKTADDRDVIQTYALTTFPQLLNASARSAAMLWYLDNYTNQVGHAQENYAREVMELHTMGVDGGYSQADVEEVARCLTGWTIQDQPNFGEFVYVPQFHDTGSKTVLGIDIPARSAAAGEQDGQDVLDILATHPSTAGFISRKLCVHFLGYDPPEDIVESVKATYLSTGGDIKAMLRVILHAPVLTNLTTPKFKRPMHLVGSLLRATDATITDPLGPLYVALLMGHFPFYWPTPDGYPDKLESWATSALPRWQWCTWLFDGSLAQYVEVDPDTLIASAGGNAPGEQANAINSILTGGRLPPSDVAILQDFYDNAIGSDQFAIWDTFGLAASLPSYQWY